MRPHSPFHDAPSISDQQSPTADLDYPFAFININIAVAEGCYKLALGDC
jgi:hypothetical protein